MYHAETNNMRELLNYLLPYDSEPEEYSELLRVRGLNPDYDENDNVVQNGEGTRVYNEMMGGNYAQAIIGKIHALTIEPTTQYGNIPYRISELKDIDYHKKYQTFKDLCNIRLSPNDFLAKRRDLEFYESDFVYCKNKHYPLNRMITLRRFPYPCIDNIMDPQIQKEQDITRMVTYWDDQTNPLSDILKFSYGLRWKKLESAMEAMQMYGGNQEGVSGFMKKTAIIFGDEALIKNRLRGNVANQVDPTHDNNKVYGPVDSITSTYIRDVGLEYEQSFDIKFEYSMRAYGDRNPDAILKDILANVLLATYNDAEFWGGGRYWVGERPSKSTTLLKFMNSDNIDTILKGGFSTIKDVININFGSPEAILKTIQGIFRGFFQMGMANILDKLGRPGIPYSNSILSGAPVGQWHLTIGHPLNPIMTIGNLICDNVDVEFPEPTLSYGDFPTKMIVTVKLKPAIPKDRAGIEMMFNYGRKRLYMPCVVKVNKDRKTSATTTTVRDYIDIGYESTKDCVNILLNSGKAVATSLEEPANKYLHHAIEVSNKYAGDYSAKVKNGANQAISKGMTYYKSTKSNIENSDKYKSVKTELTKTVTNTKQKIKTQVDKMK